MTFKFAVLIVFALLAGCSGQQIEELAVGYKDMKVEVIKTHAHPFLAEYDFKLILKSGGREVDSHEMTGDTGGYSRIDVISIDDRTLAFRDHVQIICLDLAGRRFQSCDGRTEGRELGRLDFDKNKIWRFIRMDEGN